MKAPAALTLVENGDYPSAAFCCANASEAFVRRVGICLAPRQNKL
jgi:hypothetical protein